MIDVDLLPFLVYTLHTQSYTLNGVMCELTNYPEDANNFIANVGYHSMSPSMQKLALRLAQITDTDATIPPELLRNPKDLLDLQEFSFVKIHNNKWELSDKIRTFFLSQLPEKEAVTV